MAVQFILGRSGAGKTSHCIKAIVEALSKPDDRQQLILLVPEQASFQAERAILSDKRITGYNRLNVLSFDRLGFLLSGKNTARPALSRIAQQMIIHKVLRDNKAELKVLDSSADRPGLARQMAETVAELHRYAKTPDDIDLLISELQKDEHNNLAVLKFADIGLIFREYLRFIDGWFVDPDAQLTHACREVVGAEFVKGARMWVDGFAGFTTAELAILAELLKAVADAHIALCLDPSKIDLENPDAKKLDLAGLFEPTERTYATLVEIVKKCKLQLAEPIILKEAIRFSCSPQLGFIERNVFEVEPPRIPAADNVRIISAPNERAEVRFVARQILQLVREGDCRYRDIAVIASDIERYQHYIKAYFDDYRIPFFIDKRKPLSQHPAVQLICSALQVVTGGFSGSDIFAYLKTDLVPIEHCDVDLLENYSLAFGVRGGDWTGGKDWHFAAEGDERFDEQRIKQIRLKVSVPLLKLRESLCPDDNPTKKISGRGFTRVIFDFLDSLQVREGVSDWIEEAVRAGDYATADEHRQFYDKLIDIFDELVEVFAGQQMSCDDCVAIINSAFSQLTLAFIPPSLDQVLVGSIERSRHPDLKAVFLIGATQKQFPSPIACSGILTDDDRSAAERIDFTLAATAAQKLTERQYLAYIAFTRASRFLYVTYPLADNKGAPAVRSQFVAGLESLFDDLNEESIAGEQIEIEKVHSESELADLLCSRLGKDAVGPQTGDNGQLEMLLNDICADERLAELGSRVCSAINYDNLTHLDRGIIEKRLGRQITSSATGLSVFAACPYQYFARYILELEERKEFKFEPLDLGVFYHRVLDGLLKRLNAEGKDFATVQDQELLWLLREQISQLVQTDSFISNFRGHSAHNAYIIESASEVLEDFVLAIAQMVRAGSFRPAASEVWFGEGGKRAGTLGEYEIELSDNRLLFLNGKIDRLDIAELDSEKIGIVFDYKRRESPFSWAKFYDGLDMQLPIYMLAVRSAAGSTTKNVAGAFYMPVEVSPAKSTLDKLLEKKETFSYKAKGIFDGQFFQQLDENINSGWSKFYNFRVTKGGEPYGDYGKSGILKPGDFEKVLRFTEKKVVQLAEEILSGRIDVRPYRLSGRSPCIYCKYKSVCRFDWQINDYNFLESLNKLQTLERIGTVERKIKN